MKKAEKLIKDKILENLPEGNFEIFLFGSRAKGDFRKNSDYDIGILGKEKINFSDLLLLKDEISELPYLVDIIDFNDVSENFKNLALKYTQKWN